MKDFILTELMIMSRMEQKAKSVKFHSKRTIILGKNDTGKSSLIKSIYAALGAPAAVENDLWKGLSVILLLKFSIHQKNYSILKDGKNFSVFDLEDNLLHTFDSVTNGLGPFLAELFNFKLRLNSHQGKLIIPPPAFCFLPFYVDQDYGWQHTWSSFKGLGQIKSYKKPSIEFHTGLRPNEFYEKKSEFDNYTVEIDELNKEKRMAKKVLLKIKDKLSKETFDIDINSFQEEIKALLLDCQKLKEDQEFYKSKLSELYNRKINTETQIIIASKAVKELSKDFEYAANIEDEVECPTCGAHYDNLFSERFNIALDENRADELLLDLKEELVSVNEKLKTTEDTFLTKSREIIQIEALLEEKKGEVRLQDVIEKEGRKELSTIFNYDIIELENSIGDILVKQQNLKQRLDTLDNKKRKEEIKSFYKDIMKTNLRAVDVTNMPEKSYSDITKSINGTGSAGARTLIAYYFTMFKVIAKYSSSIFCPIVIDSPNQQAQDPAHIHNIYNFIRNNQPTNSQMIVGLEELYDVNFEGEIIELKEKYHLLNEEDYKNVFPIINAYLKKTYPADLFS